MKWEWNEIYAGISNCIFENRPINLSDIKYVDKNGKNCLLGMTINPIKDDKNVLKGFLIYGRDITEKKLVEQQLLQSSKMATIGEIATGIAHEVNQPLNIIKMASQYMLDSIKEKYCTEEFIVERMEKIVKQVDRAARIITHLKEFGRKSDFSPESIDPNLPIRVAFDMLGEQLRIHSVNVSLELDDSLPPIRGDSQKLEQVFINMIINAKDAFEEMNIPLRNKMIHVKSYFKDDEKAICIEFKDNGPGMPANIVDKIFEPFFTTKEVGKGTGLGLSISYGIIKSHQGTIDVKSNDSGTTFIIRLPAVSKTLDEKNESV
jgi:histidine kinase